MTGVPLVIIEISFFALCFIGIMLSDVMIDLGAKKQWAKRRVDQ